jgi:hypothetical protein
VSSEEQVGTGISSPRQVVPLTTFYPIMFFNIILSGTIIRGTLKTPNSQLVTPISIKLQRPDGYD